MFLASTGGPLQEITLGHVGVQADASVSKLEQLHGDVSRNFRSNRPDDNVALLKQLHRLIAQLVLPEDEAIEQYKLILEYATQIRQNAGENLAENESVLSQHTLHAAWAWIKPGVSIPTASGPHTEFAFAFLATCFWTTCDAGPPGAAMAMTIAA